jgi:hypothetical protein
VAVSSILDDEVSSCDLEFSEDLPAVDEFACWAFGPNGLPDLEVLAYGDFSFQGRQPNVLLCRSEDKPDHGYLCDMSFSAKGFRELKKQDVRLWEMVQDNIDFLEACPGDYLLHRW